MASKLLIVESPGKVKKLSQILGPDWLVRASVGHIRELANDGEDSLGFDLGENSVRCRFTARGARGQEVIQTLKAAVKQVKTVVLATDYDREGETIAWHIQQALNLKNPQRVVYTEITPAAVQAAIARPRSLDLNLVHSGLCRTVLDKLVGYRGSPLLWQLHNGAKSMGRVQSATLHIICNRERQIQTFVPQDYWSVFVDYGEGFRAYYHTETGATSPSPHPPTSPPHPPLIPSPPHPLTPDPPDD
ncbi:MAG: DNA topoisomerase, partial [Elainella sp.]